MYKVYALSIAVPEEISCDLEHTDRPTDIKVIPWNLKSGSIINETNWFHNWEMQNGHVCLLAGKKTNGLYVLHYIDEGILFAVSPDGLIIYYEALDSSEEDNIENIRHLLFTQVLAMVMNLCGSEALHASSVLNSSGAIAFVGNSGEGKSTIAATLVKDGLQLLSDNVVPIFNYKNQIWTSSGPRDIGLWPWVWKSLNPRANVENQTEKCRVTFSNKEHCTGEFSLSHIYFLNPIKENKISIEPVTLQEGLIELLKSAYRLDINDSSMLQRQFSTLYQTTQLVRMKKISYPFDIPDPFELSKAIKSDCLNSSRLVLQLLR